MRVTPPLLALALAVALAGLATSCARAIIYSCGADADAARVDVRAPADRAYNLEIVNVDGPGRGGMCSPPAYAIGEEATLIEMSEGTYQLLAKAEDTRAPYAFPLHGEVSVRPGRCYVPAMTCDGAARPDALTCRLVLKPTDCASHLLPRRVVIRGERGC